MGKKSQISLFFIAGIVLLIAASFLIYISSNKAKSDIAREQEIVAIDTTFSFVPIKSNINSCVEEISKKAIAYTGLHGGYYEVPEPKVNYFFDDIPYYVYQGENHMPSKNVIENQVSDYIAEILPECVGGLNDTEGIRIEGEINFVNASIEDDAVFIYVNYPILVIKADLKSQISEFNAKVPVRLSTLYKIASNITQEKINNNGALCVDCLADLATVHKVYLDALSHQEDSLIFTIFDNTTKIDEEAFIFSFATKS